ncbi:caspase family protein [Streptomyces sp. NBC_01104]|uniref:caspase family protein n=1 Tax=Streptomyces sp. NBC_01104 TaxID=2903750 RepID=UPI00386613BE|nr:caspase family protein [Streptomyces sp. NBC_01104]
MDSDRRALLVGVPQQTERAFPLRSIGDPVREDLRRMREALEACEYRCTVLGPGGPDESRRDAIQDAVRDALRSVPAGGVLFVYFSGHGLHLGGKDHLVPSNAKALADGSPDTDSLIDLDRDFFGMLGPTACPAALVIACFDACRDGSGTSGIRPYHYRAPHPTQLVVGNSCAPGETSGYDADGSHFTKGLAYALHPDSPHRTLRQVSASVTAELRDHEQHPQWSPAGDLPDVVVADTGGVPEWVQAVSTAHLWSLPCSDPPEVQEVLRERVEAAVRSLSGKYRRASEQMPHPWRDDDYPMRVLDSVAGLPTGTRPLSALEKALLCGLPFMLATALAEEFTALFDSFKGFARLDAAQMRHVLREHEHDFSALDENRVRRLHARDRTDEAWALTTWRLLKRRSGLRIAGAEETDHLVDCASRLVDVLLQDVAASHQKALRAIVDRLARHHLTYPSCTALDDYSGTLSHFKVTSRGASQLNDHDLAARWSLGAALAVDVRELSEMVAEHIGTMYPLGPQEVLLCLEDASRRLDEERAVVEVLQCPHGALHKALELHATRCREALSRLHGMDLPVHLNWLRFVRTIDVSVHPSPGAYNLPLLTFQFDQRAVSHLLMGEQLYGDPALALRELYQNALDACRYRDYRYKWATSQGGGDPDWPGRILITQYQQDGRTVIECLDNGVGMTAEQLKDLFARAGRKLSDSSEFQHELGEWQQAGIEPRFNSRFGIGVLSYFMLADEITVVTRPTNARGQATGEPLQADIVGTATLFRINPARHDNGDVAKVEHGGTLVRLYLSADQTNQTGRPAGGLSASRTLGELLWYTEFDTQVRDDSTGHFVVWERGKLRIPHDEVRASLAVGGTAGELWWVDGEGRLLADGIATSRNTFGCVINVRDQRDLTLSVSRNEVQSWDQGKAADLLAAHLPELASWPRVTLAWLLRFGQEAPRLGDDLLRVFADIPLRVESPRSRHGAAPGAGSGQDGVFRISDIGWCPFDAVFLTNEELPAFLKGSIHRDDVRGWRSSVLGRSPDHTSPSQVRTTLGLVASNQGGSMADLRTALSPHPGSKATVVPAETSAADWFLHSEHPVAHQAGLRRTPPGEDGVIWLPLDSTERALLGWRRTLLGRTADLSVPAFLPASIGIARISATQAAARRRYGVSRRQQPWPWDVLVAVAAQHRIPLGELWAEFEDFPESLFGPLPELPEHLVDSVPRPSDAIWSVFEDARREGLLGPKALRDWAERYETLAMPGHVRRLLSYLDVRDTLTRESRSLTERLLGCQAFFQDGELSVIDAVRAAAGAQVSVAEVIELAVELREPLELTSIPEITDGEMRPPKWLAGMWFRKRESERPEERNWLDAAALYSVRRLPREQLQQGLELLAGLGVRCPVATAPLEDVIDGDADLDTSALVKGTLNTYEGDSVTLVDRWEIDAGKLLWFAAHRQLTIGEALERATAVAVRVGMPLTVRPPKSTWHLEVTPALWTAMNGAANLGDTHSGLRPEVTPLSMARLAYIEDLTLGEAVHLLRPFEELGVPLPELGSATEVALAHKPTEDDLWALASDRDGSEPPIPVQVDPLTVVRTALRLGHDLRPVYRMFAAYRPFGMVVDFPEPDDGMGVPRWEDPIILSFAGDGQEPALEGAVSERRLAWCAEAVGRTGDTEWVRERLRLYASVFRLDIPEAPARTKEM